YLIIPDKTNHFSMVWETISGFGLFIVRILLQFTVIVNFRFRKRVESMLRLVPQRTKYRFAQSPPPDIMQPMVLKGKLYPTLMYDGFENLLFITYGKLGCGQFGHFDTGPARSEEH